MDYGKLTLFAGINERMHYLSERQTVLAQNIANANTPGYQARDLKPVDFANVLAHEAGRTQLAVTQPGHQKPMHDPGTYKEVKKRKSFETTINGNSVVMDEQLQKLSDNNMNYQETTALYKKVTDMVRLATGANR